MLIVCPNCQTIYSVDRRGFEPNGRTVRCHNCGNSWRQGLVSEDTAPQTLPAAGQPHTSQYGPAQTPYPQAGYPPPGYPPYPPQGYAPYPPPGYPSANTQAATQMAAPSPAPVEPEPAPSPANDPLDIVEPDFDLPDPEEEDDDLDDAMAANIDELFSEDDEDESAEEEAASEEPDTPEIPEIDEAPSGTDDLSDEDIDNLFDDDEEIGGIASMVDGGSNSGDDDGFDNFDDIPEPDPLPESLTGALDDDDDEEEDEDAPRAARAMRRKKPKKKGKGGLIATVVILVLLIGVLASGYVARALIVELVPQAKPIYDMVGIDTGVLGDGLEIQNVQMSRETEGGVDILLVSGTVANAVKEPAPVPFLQAILLDGDGNELQHVVQEPSKNELAPRTAMDFTIRIEEPSPLARRVEVTFAPRNDNGNSGH